MQTTQSFVNKKKDQGYGMGLYIQDDNTNNKRLKHDGAVAGYNSLMIFDPRSRIGIILLSYRDNTTPILDRQGNILLNKLLKADTQP
jgi:CubicO group peptidase (beta-lactamase class C family)